MQNCVVKPYCSTVEKKKGVCRTCKEYDKFDKKKNKTATDIGRANKRKGKKSEKKLLLHFQRQDFDARIIEGSGSLKKILDDHDADLRITINGVERKVENKKRTSFERIRKLINDNKILYITNFCYVMDENIFYDIVKNGNTKYPIREVSDRNFGELHKFFSQDNADIVSLDESYKDFLFALSINLFEEIIESLH